VSRDILGAMLGRLKHAVVIYVMLSTSSAKYVRSNGLDIFAVFRLTMNDWTSLMYFEKLAVQSRMKSAYLE
jgi:hypothetical protein